jgi:hypothetical protein
MLLQPDMKAYFIAKVQTTPQKDFGKVTMEIHFFAFSSGFTDERVQGQTKNYQC